MINFGINLNFHNKKLIFKVNFVYNFLISSFHAIQNDNIKKYNFVFDYFFLSLPELLEESLKFEVRF